MPWNTGPRLVFLVLQAHRNVQRDTHLLDYVYVPKQAITPCRTAVYFDMLSQPFLPYLFCRSRVESYQRMF